jgi:hypothetical protein
VVDTDIDFARSSLADMRRAFENRDWGETLAIYEQQRDAFKKERNLRVEATCLAARALVARSDRPGARAVLKPIAMSNYTKAVHYHFLAHAFLDLKNYREVVRLCERAAELVDAEKASIDTDGPTSTGPS